MDINAIIIKIILLAPPLLFALTLHEIAHGTVAYHLGDPTSKNAGRLSLNPFMHLDPAGTVTFFLTSIVGIGIGWAKPVLVNPRYFRNPKKGMMLVAIAGPASNIVLAVCSAVLFKMLLFSQNFIPMPILYPLGMMLKYSVQINVMLAVFNLIPIPPLDGSKVLFGILSPSMAYKYAKIEPYGFLLVLLLVFTGIFSAIFYPIIIATTQLLLG